MICTGENCDIISCMGKCVMISCTGEGCHDIMYRGRLLYNVRRKDVLISYMGMI